MLSLCVIVALLVGAWQPLLAQEAQDEPAPQGLRPDAPKYAVHGPFGVGYKPVVIGTETDRPLEVGLWYPAMIPAGVEEAVTYSVTLKYPAEGIEQPAPIFGRALQDAEVDPAAAPYPLVIFSPGFASNGPTYNTIIEHLTSHGFVVLAPEHQEQWDPEWSEIWSASIDRPQDVKQTLDYAEEINSPDGDMTGMIDMDNVAVAGHSYGGYTAMAMAGAQYDLDAFNARCAALAPDDPNNFLCLPVVPYEAEMAARAGLDPMPEGLWPSLGDPRVKAILPIAGDSYLFDKAGMAKVTVPMLALGGTEDTGTPYAWGSKPAYDYAGSAQKALVTFGGAEHMIASSCAGRPWISQIIFYQWACFDPVWDKDRALDLINHFATAFLLAELKGDAEAAAALAPENVSFPGIEYQAEGYTPAPAATLDEATIAKIEAMVEQMMADTGTPGYALGIVKDGQIVYTKGFGVERVGEDKPVTEHTVFGTGCVGKPAVATAIMQLVDAGKIDLDAPVTDYLPYFKLADERYKEITVRQLITNRSGLPDVEDWFSPPVEYDDGVLERYVRSLDNIKLLFAPGQRWYYTGMGYIVLADVIQKVTGQTFEDYLQQHILDPLGMEDTLLIVGEADQAHVAGNHVHDNAGELVISDIFPYRRQFAAAAPLFSSIADLARYALAHLNRGELDGQHILPAADYDAMWEPISAMNSPLFPALQAHYGMGWFVGTLDGHRAVGHFGADEGYAALMLLVPDDNTGLVLASNFFDWDEFNISGWETGIDIMKMLLSTEPEAEATGSN